MDSKTNTTTKSQAQQASATKSALAKVLILSVIGVGLSVVANTKSFADFFANKSGQDSLKPKVMVGSVNKTLEQFSFTSEQGVQYHVHDPSNILDELAKNRGIFNDLYQLNRVRIKAIVSKAGNYGHMGYYERQITIVSLVDDEAETV